MRLCARGLHNASLIKRHDVGVMNTDLDGFNVSDLCVCLTGEHVLFI